MRKLPPTLLLKSQNEIMVEFVPGEGRTRKEFDEKDEGWRHLAILVSDFGKVVTDLTRKKLSRLAIPKLAAAERSERVSLRIQRKI